MFITGYKQTAHIAVFKVSYTTNNTLYLQTYVLKEREQKENTTTAMSTSFANFLSQKTIYKFEVFCLKGQKTQNTKSHKSIIHKKLRL